MTVPVLRYQIRAPKKISKLVYQLNLRGFRTENITWGDPILIELKSHKEFIDNVNRARRCGKREIYDFYEFLIEEVDFKMNIHPYVGHPHEPVIVNIILKHNQIKKFERLFYDAFIRHIHNEKKLLQKYEMQNLYEQESED
jgi:hypothetical protein